MRKITKCPWSSWSPGPELLALCFDKSLGFSFLFRGKRTAREVENREVEGVKPEDHMVERAQLCRTHGLRWDGGNSGGGGRYFLSSHTRKAFCIGVCQAISFLLWVVYIASDDSTFPPLMT